MGAVLLIAFPVVVLAASETWWWEHRLTPTWRLLAGSDDRVVYSVETDRPAVALTIDDGPDPAATPAILDVLREHGAQATFFLIADRIPGNEGIVNRIVAEGHEIGNHLTADRPSIDLAPEAFEHNLARAHRVLSHWRSPRWFRPASGWYDESMIEIAERHGYRTALGRVYPLDAALPAPVLAARYIRWQAAPGEIVILHDGGERGRNTARTLERVLPDLEARGLEVVTLSMLAGQR